MWVYELLYWIKFKNMRHFALFALYIIVPIEAWHKWQLIGPINLPRHKNAESKEAKAVDIKGEWAQCTRLSFRDFISATTSLRGRYYTEQKTKLKLSELKTNWNNSMRNKLSWLTKKFWRTWNSFCGEFQNTFWKSAAKTQTVFTISSRRSMTKNNFWSKTFSFDWESTASLRILRKNQKTLYQYIKRRPGHSERYVEKLIQDSKITAWFQIIWDYRSLNFSTTGKMSYRLMTWKPTDHFTSTCSF